VTVAALYDVHGNLPALESVLREVRAESVEVTVVGGDIAWGPFPRATVDALRTLRNVRFIRGNADREVAAGTEGVPADDDVFAAITAWSARQLTSEQREWLAELPPSFSTGVDGLGDVLFCHASPRSDEEIITPSSPVSRIAAALRSVRERTVVCGHTHMQFELPVGDRVVVNAGSVGLPYQGRPGAYWALLGPGVELRRTDYDVVGATDAMAATTCPHVHEVFVESLLRPPSAEEATEQFEAMARDRTY
jgi:predicted phosphodiesterase